MVGHEDWVYMAIYNPDNSMIASCSEDTTIKLWNANRLILIDTL